MTQPAADRLSAETSLAAPGCHAIIVTYNSERYLPGLLADLQPLVDERRLSVTFVDNGSTDATTDVLKDLPWLRLIEAGGNLGYAGGINVARRELPTDEPLLILNPDLRLGAGTAATLLAALADPTVGIAVPTILEPTGEVYPSLRREPSLLRALGDAVLGSRFQGRSARFSEMIWNGPDDTQGQDVGWATGAVMLISGACNLAVGDWDEARFFMYSEETDLCRRARTAGFSVRYVPLARATHFGSGSGSSPELYALMAINRIRYYEKYHRKAASIVFRGLVFGHAILRLHSAGQRRALAMTVRRSRWVALPGSRPAAAGRRG